MPPRGVAGGVAAAVTTDVATDVADSAADSEAGRSGSGAWLATASGFSAAAFALRVIFAARSDTSWSNGLRNSFDSTPLPSSMP